MIKEKTEEGQDLSGMHAAITRHTTRFAILPLTVVASVS